jgi:hypothetical protein
MSCELYSLSQAREVHLVLREFALGSKNEGLFYRVSSENHQSS